MNEVERRFAADPVLAALMPECGLDPAALPWELRENSQSEWVRAGAGGADGVDLILDSDGSASARWYRPSPKTSVCYDLDEQGQKSVTLEGTILAETVLAAAAGRRLDEVVDIPGAAGLRIVEGRKVATFNMPEDTRLTVEPY